MAEIFDHEGSLHRMGGDHELFQEMVGLLLADAPLLLRALTSACESGDLAGAERAAHTLKGLASNFGGQRAVAAAAEVERLAKAKQAARLPAATRELQAALDELMAALATPAREMSRSG
jgi:two-component system, sensor histidine kinase and response regulator